MTANPQVDDSGNGHTPGAVFCYERFEEQLCELARTESEAARALAIEALERLRAITDWQLRSEDGPEHEDEVGEAGQEDEEGIHAVEASEGAGAT